jgi:hypothetical protein
MLFYCQSCDLWYLVFVHMLFLFYYLYFLIYDINIIFHGSIDHASTIIGYLSIVITFVTLNVTCDHIGTSFLNIYFIIPAICNLMSKVSTIKKMTIKQICIPGSELSSLWHSPSEFFPLLTMIMIEASLWLEHGRSY